MREKARKAIIAAFLAGWTGADAFPVGLPNQPFKEPQSGSHGRLTIQFGARFPASVGAYRKRQVGVLHLQIFTPENGGTSAAAKAEDLLATIFDLKKILIEPGLIVCFELVGNDGTGRLSGLEQTNVSVDFRVDLTT